MISLAEHEDAERARTFISAGIDPDKAMRLTGVIRHTEDTTNDLAELARKRAALLEVLIGQGVSTYAASTALLCHPSPHEPLPASDTDDTKETNAQDA